MRLSERHDGAASVWRQRVRGLSCLWIFCQHQQPTDDTTQGWRLIVITATVYSHTKTIHGAISLRGCRPSRVKRSILAARQKRRLFQGNESCSSLRAGGLDHVNSGCARGGYRGRNHACEQQYKGRAAHRQCAWRFQWANTPISAPFLPSTGPVVLRVSRGDRGDQPLIGTSAIRNSSKAPKISNIDFSNRHKIPQMPGAPCLTALRQARISLAQSIHPEGAP